MASIGTELIAKGDWLVSNGQSFFRTVSRNVAQAVH